MTNLPARRSFAWLEDAWRDLLYAVRTLSKAPAFTAVAVLTLALGIGAVTVIYSVVHNVIVDPLPYRDADRLSTSTSRTHSLPACAARSPPVN